MKELNERQRAEYAQKLYDQQRTTLRQMEDRNLELEKKFSELTRMNLEMQRTERELREELEHSVPRAVSDADKRYVLVFQVFSFSSTFKIKIFRRISELEGAEIQAKQEMARLREISDVATYQVGAINDLKVLDEKEFQSLRRQLVDLQSKSDDKNEIGKS